MQIHTHAAGDEVDVADGDPVFDRDGHRLAHPMEVARPFGAIDLVQLLPVLDAELRLVIRAIGERGDAQVWTGELLRRAQDVHARERGPRALAAARRTVDAA